MKTKECKHTWEADIEPIEEGYFKVWYCTKCKRKSYSDYHHNGDTYEHPGFLPTFKLDKE